MCGAGAAVVGGGQRVPVLGGGGRGVRSGWLVIDEDRNLAERGPVGLGNGCQGAIDEGLERGRAGTGASETPR